MLKEVIVVEGKQDEVAVRRALEAETIITGGFALNSRTMAKIKIAYEQRGIIILTDPDRAGENIRRRLSEHFPEAKHAFVPRNQAYKNKDIGIEQAQPQAILDALSKVHTQIMQPGKEFCLGDLHAFGLVGEPDSAVLRDALGAELGIGYANAKQFVQRLNNYGITKEAFEAGMKKLLNTNNN